MRVAEIQNLDDFTCYLLTYVAEADLKVTPAEKDLILEHVTPEKYEVIKRFIDNRSDYENLQLIDYYKNEFITTEEERNALIEELGKVVHADNAGQMEQYMLRAIQKFI
jgi:uncharacterized tellurite resistance protein B-like protein